MTRAEVCKEVVDDCLQAISFYKIFGYPTGLGALIARKESLKLFRKRYFGGGTVTVSVADLDYVR